jgi:hypothetical protein
MKILPIYLSLLVLAGALPGARGEEFRTDINPALLYYQAFAAAPNLDPADNNYLRPSTGDWRGQKLTPRFAELLAKYDTQLRLVREAAHATVPCDWGVDWSAGPNTMMLYLARAKAVVQTARLHAMWALQQGQPADACQDLLAALVLGRNLTRDGTFMSVLVQIAIEAIICDAIAENFGRFPPEVLQQLAAGLDAPPVRGTVVAGILSETGTYSGWLSRKVVELQRQYPGNDAKVMEEIRRLLFSGPRAPGEGDPWKEFKRAAGGTSEGVFKLLQERSTMYHRTAELVALPYPEYKSQREAFMAEVEKSHNPFATNAVPAFVRGRAKEFRIQVIMAMVRAAVEYKLHGEQGLRSVTDPCGQGPFGFRRFVFEGVDRGLELRSADDIGDYPQVLVFVEKEGPPFRVDGRNVGQALASPQSPQSASERFRERYGARYGK